MRWLLVAALALASCVRPEAEFFAPPRALPPGRDGGSMRASGSLPKLVLGVMPYREPAALVKTHEKLVAWLSQTLEIPVELRIGSTYDELGRWLANGEIQLASLSPYPYVRISRTTKLTPLVSAIFDGSDAASGYVFVRRDHPARTLEALEGASFGFVDEASTTGYLYPLMLLRERGFEPKSFFGSTQFFGNHERVLLAVHEGQVQAGATYQGSMSALKRDRGIEPLDFRIIAKTPRAPRDVYCVRADLPADAQLAIQRALLALSSRDPATREVLAPLNFNGFFVPDDALYDPIRAISTPDGPTP